jgi:hypothetical protein
LKFWIIMNELIGGRWTHNRSGLPVEEDRQETEHERGRNR